MKQAILSHYGFSHLPFGKDIATEAVFQTTDVSESRAMLELGLDSEDIMLLTGTIGCGKSVILRHLCASLDLTRYQPIYLRGGPMSPGELYKLILRGMKIDPPYSAPKAKSLYFVSVAEATRTPIVIIDDTQDVSPEALLALKAMTNFASDSQTRITFILAGQPELATILGYAHFDSLRDRIRLQRQLSGMSLEETCAYIDHRLAVAHRVEKLFSDAAKAEIFKRSDGIARHINTLCYQAIVRGAIEDKRIIDTQDLPHQTL